MIRDLTRVLMQLDDGRLWRIVLKAAIAASGLLALLVAGLTLLAASLAATGLLWLDAVLPWLTGAGGVIVAFLLLPITAASLLGLFADAVADAVEARWYPTLARPSPPSVLVGLVQTLRLLALAVGLNVLVLPLYFLLPGLNVIIFLVLNGYLLGREYFETVAARRLSVPAAAALRRTHRWRVMAAGVVIAAVALVPVLNVLVPVAGTALMVHRCQSLRPPPHPRTARRKE